MKIKTAGLALLLATLSQGCINPSEFVRITRHNAPLDHKEEVYNKRNKIEGGYRVGEYIMNEKEYKWILEDSQYFPGPQWFSLSDEKRDELIINICSKLDKDNDRIISSSEF